MYNQYTQSKVLVVALVLSMFVVALVPLMKGSYNTTIAKPTENVTFTLASWDYPDEYGQGIRNVALEQYINGEWVALTDPSPPKGYYYSGSEFNITSGANGGGNISIVIQCFLNATLCDIDDIDDGPALIRHTITVTNTTATVFYQQGFDLTYQTDALDPLYFYQYEVVANFVPISGIVYTATITYDVLLIPEGSENATMFFDGNDPYSTYTYSDGSGSQGESGQFYDYAMNTDLSGDTECFGFDEFAVESTLSASVLFTPTDMTGTYRYQPILYTYQKTDLTSSTHWAVAIFWYESNLWLYHNTANGETINGELLVATSPIENHEYSCILANSGNDTWVRVYDTDTSTVVYNGTTTTFNYDATALYAGFGQYSAGNGGMQGRWDNFTVAGFALSGDWEEVGDAKLYFSVPFDYWALNMILVFGGLILMLVSVCMMAVKVRDRTITRDAGILFLFLFCVGWGLFIGGTLIG